MKDQLVAAVRVITLFTVVWLLLLIAGVAVSQGAQPDPYGPYRAVCEIRTNGVQGSATLIATTDSKALLLSCRHVCQSVGSSVTANWLWARGQVTTGHVIHVIEGRSFQNDLALCVVDRPRGVKPLKVKRVSPSDGPWVGAGFRSGTMRHFTAGSVRLEGAQIVTFDGAAVSGMSGGPFLNRHGEVVGVVVASDRKTKSVSADGDWLHGMVGQFRRRK